MWRLGLSGLVYVAVCCCLLFIAVAHVTDPSEVSALQAIKNSLIDPVNHLRYWGRGDPCASNWTGVLCFDSVLEDGYLHVRELQLLNMNLSGSLAPELGGLTRLVILDFMWNELTGSIPKEIGSLSDLILLLLNGNQLSGSLPDELGYLSKLNRLQVDQNHMTGSIPKSFANLSSVKHLHLNNNSFSGEIPAELSNLSTLIHLLLDFNNFSGILPPEIAKLTELRILQLDNNQFNGSAIPASYGNFPNLAKLSLRNCSLQGAVPDLSGIPSLLYVDLSQNQLTGQIPSNTVSENITTIDLSNNNLNGSIPESFSNLASLQKMSLANNFLSGSVPAGMWQNKTLDANARLLIDLRNNQLLNISGDLVLPNNVTLRLGGNPICNKANIPNIGLFCGSEAGPDVTSKDSTNSNNASCPIAACPTDNFFDYVPESPISCFCASPLRIGYRLKSPSFSFFPPYKYIFEKYLTSTLGLDLYQLRIDSSSWEEGPHRLKMDLKLYPKANDNHVNTFNGSEVERIRGRFTSWNFPRDDFFGPYELLNFTLLGPYAAMDARTQETGISKGILAAVVVGAMAFAVAISAIVTFLILRKHARYHQSLSRKRLSSSRVSMKLEGVKEFKFKELSQATNNFDNSTQVGRGGYGKVYKGVLSDNVIVAIKRAEEGSLQGQKEFLTEIKLLSRLHHRNLVSLVGYCDEEEEQMLVYEFVSNGTLRDWLSAKRKQGLNFAMRVQIALDSAKGILYLHTEANPPVFHRDIKASNILLDSNLMAKVSDFGLSLLAPVLDEDGTIPTHVSTIVKGTPGYLDPEYFLTHKLTDKSDVYSLGVVLLELLTSMQPISHGKNIVREVNTAHESGMIFSIIDSRMGSYPSECIEKFMSLALSCCHDKPEHRPSMWNIVRELENILKMVSKTDAIAIDSEPTTSVFSAQSASSSSNMVSRDPYLSSSVSGSDLVSDFIPIISPR